MTGLDCNILVQLAMADHPAHAETKVAVNTETLCGQKLVLPPLVMTEFLHVVTDDRRFSPPLTMIEATGWLEAFLASPLVGLIHPTDACFAQTLRWMRQFKLGRKRILDTHLAAIYHTCGVNRLLTSNPRDFTVFGGFEIVSP